ncbi:MAG: hypothetical protein AAF741_15695 [Bacteroidota bacterium]
MQNELPPFPEAIGDELDEIRIAVGLAKQYLEKAEELLADASRRLQRIQGQLAKPKSPNAKQAA